MFGDQNAGNFPIYNKNLINMSKTTPNPSKYRIKRPFSMISDTCNLNNDFSNPNKKFKMYNDSAFAFEPKKVTNFNSTIKPHNNYQFIEYESPNIINNNSTYTPNSGELKR